MYTLNLINLREAAFALDPQLLAYVENLPGIVHRICNHPDHVQPASIQLVVCTQRLMGQANQLSNIKHLLQQGQINLCLIPDGEILANDVVTSFRDFILWPCSQAEFRARLTRHLGAGLANPLDKNNLLEEFSSLNLIGESSAFIQSARLIKKMSSCQAAVLIQGETGTGKENAARAIHYLSKRREQAFVPVNCAAIPDELIESELFGHEKGAFTDAKQTQTGLVTLANGGTLFLDEVDSLSAKAQAALLRFLQTQEYRPLGCKKTMHANVRVLAATNANLKEWVAQKRFREDLYFRLNVLNLTIPPLRERLDDIPLLAKNFLHRFSIEHQSEPKNLSAAGLEFLMQQQWPGNIRELENTLLRAFLLSPDETLVFEETSAKFFAQEPTTTAAAAAPIDSEAINSPNSSLNLMDKKTTLSFQHAKEIAINEFEAKYLARVMHLAQGNVSEAARIAGKERRALGKLLQKYAIDKRQFRAADL